MVWDTARGCSMSLSLSLNRIAAWPTCTTLTHGEGKLYMVDKEREGSLLIQKSDSRNWFKYLHISALLQKDSSTIRRLIKTGSSFHKILWNFFVWGKVCLAETCIISKIITSFHSKSPAHWFAPRQCSIQLDKENGNSVPSFSCTSPSLSFSDYWDLQLSKRMLYYLGMPIQEKLL